ncbi:BRO family protein [Paenarthrobacter nicotinovorans]|uniref:BRO family protein n=1 Tax=Paenarthrobacter nicotinovorans TaxID=29320 RepID=UPI00380151CE
MTTVQLFNYGDRGVRTVQVDGQPCFIANDLCAILDLSNPRTSLALLEDDEKGVHSVDTPGGTQQMAYVTESGMYSLVLRSRKSEAKAFKRWVTREVLPEIRRTGAYGGSPALTGKQLLAAALLEAQATMAEKDFQIHAQAQQIEAAAPKVTYVDQFVAEHDLLSFRTVAASLDVGEQELRQYLTAKKWIYCQTDERWSSTHGKKLKRNRYSAYADKKSYFQPVLNHEAPRFRGGEVMHTLKITPAGASAITRLYTASTKELTA